MMLELGPTRESLEQEEVKKNQVVTHSQDAVG